MFSRACCLWPAKADGLCLRRSALLAASLHTQVWGDLISECCGTPHLGGLP